VNNLVMDNVNIKMAPPSEKRSKTRKETPASADQDGQSSK